MASIVFFTAPGCGSGRRFLPRLLQPGPISGSCPWPSPAPAGSQSRFCSSRLAGRAAEG
jgi:hypothetical protein